MKPNASLIDYWSFSLSELCSAITLRRPGFKSCRFTLMEASHSYTLWIVKSSSQVSTLISRSYHLTAYTLKNHDFFQFGEKLLSFFSDPFGNCTHWYTRCCFFTTKSQLVTFIMLQMHWRQFGLKCAGDRDAFGNAFLEVLGTMRMHSFFSL